MELLIFYYKLALPQSSQLVHVQPQTKRSSFDSSLFLTPPSNPLANGFSTPLPRIHSLISTIMCHHLLSDLQQESPVFVSQLSSLLQGMTSWQLIFYFLLEKGDRLFLALLTFLLFSINTYEVPAVGRHCFCILRDSWTTMSARRLCLKDQVFNWIVHSMRGKKLNSWSDIDSLRIYFISDWVPIMVAFEACDSL